MKSSYLVWLIIGLVVLVLVFASNMKLENPKLALIIDDAGDDFHQIAKFLELDTPFTFSVLPFREYSSSVARLINSEGREIMLHLPMESFIKQPASSLKYITVGMNPGDVALIVNESLAEVPFAKGINNHQGSKATEDAALMEVLAGVLKQKNLYFIDSHTSEKTVAEKIMASIGVKTASNEFFLDPKDEYEYIKARLKDLIELVKEKGELIAIAHARPNTFKALSEGIPLFKKQGIRFVYVSQILD